MFPRASALLAIAIAVVTSARMERRMHVRRGNSNNSQCDTGSVKCCDNVANVRFHRFVVTRAPSLTPSKGI